MKQTAAPNTGFSVIAPRRITLAGRPADRRELCAKYAGGFLFEGVPDPKLTRNIV